jgi:hypothetical protein
MNRECALKVVLVLVGLLFSSVGVPMVIMVRIVLQPRSESALPIAINTANEAMILSLYATLGVFLLLAARNPSAHRSVIAYAAWSSFAHAAVMAVMSIQVPTARTEWLITAVALGIIGALLTVLAPGKHIKRNSFLPRIAGQRSPKLRTRSQPAAASTPTSTK